MGEIRLVFEENKGKVYAAHGRALKRRPDLRGKVKYELLVAPSGEVTECKVVSSDLSDVTLESELQSVLKGFNFGAKDVSPFKVTWPITLLPS